MAPSNSVVSTSGETMVESSLQPVSFSDNTTIHTTLATNLSTVALNTSGPDGCIRVVFSELEFLPWDNPDNIVSAEVETITRRIKDNLLPFMFLIGGPGNVINMVVFYKQSLKDRVNLCLFALALADELYLIGVMLLNVEQLYIQFTTGERFGPMIIFFNNSQLTFMGFRYVSCVLSAIISSERCYCVLHPLHYHTMMRTRTMGAVIVIVYVVVLGLYHIIAFRYRIGCLYDPMTDVVVNSGVIGSFYRAHKQFIDFLSGFFIIGLVSLALLIVTVMTTITAVRLRKVVTWRSGTSVSISSQEVVSLTKMLIGNSSLFMACLFPTCVTLFLWSLFPEMNSGRRNQNFYLTTLWITQFFAFLNSTFNIIVYYTMGSRYRETFQALFRRRLNTDQKA